MVENRGAMKGKKVSSMGFVNIMETRMAKIKLVMSNVLIKVEDTKDSLYEIKSEMRRPLRVQDFPIKAKLSAIGKILDESKAEGSGSDQEP
ncbi:hypothetical protein PVK06_015970 [Gossypium arboreum]|uniref:Uncharacterized protein n=1 Tax=Gossypium arboreum TaxID=29729 RepID=A0ABR0PYP8_GOSAR|nr:hypothetical protein PVK06_015970 [Gossypium arboreum]